MPILTYFDAFNQPPNTLLTNRDANLTGDKYTKLPAYSSRSVADQLQRELGGRVAKAGKGWSVRCPVHDDNNPSLNIAEGDRQPLLVQCFAGCEQGTVIQALKDRGLWPGVAADPQWRPAPRRESIKGASKRPAQRKKGPITAIYAYTDERGALLFETLRHNPKDFSQRRPNGRGGWIWDLDGVRRILYRLPELLTARVIFITEGEKDCETLRSHGFVATTCPLGCGKWKPEFNPFFRGKEVYVVPDNDPPGRRHAEQVKAGIEPFAARVSTIRLHGAHDITAWFEDYGGTAEALAQGLGGAD